MGKQFLTAMTAIMLASFSMNAYDVVNINYDQKTLEQLTLNTTAQVLTNELHNIQVDSIKKKQSKLMGLITGIAAEKELLVQTYKNVSGFKKESKYYVAMAKTGADIIKHSSQAVELIGNSKLEGKAMATIKLADLVAQAVSLGKAFADIVADCEVPNPLDQSAKGTKDKYNLLNRHERLYLANDILFRLKNIDHAICYMIYLTKNAGWRDLLFQLDRKTYLNAITTNREINDIINKWERIGK